MEILFVAKIFFLTLLKISYGIIIHSLILASLMPITVLITKDKSFILKQYFKFRKYMGLKEW